MAETLEQNFRWLNFIDAVFILVEQMVPIEQKYDIINMSYDNIAGCALIW